MEKRLLSLSAGAASAMGIVTGLPAVANAAPAPEVQPTQATTLAKQWPKGCSYDKWINPSPGRAEGTRAYCKSGGGKFKALVICRPMSGGPVVTRESPVWTTASSRKRSYVYCPPMTVYSSSGNMTKAG